MPATKDEKEHKDRFFKFLFGNEEYKEYTLELYNALNGSNYSDPEMIKFNTLDDAIFIHMKNDNSFVIGNVMNLWEQQSSWNPNMALRELIYFVDLLKNSIKLCDPNALHKQKAYKIPMPKFYVFYNGEKKEPLEKWLYLDDLFLRDTDIAKNAEPDIWMRVKMINVNYSTSVESIVTKCRPLMEYSVLMQSIRARRKEIGTSEAVKSVLSNVPDSFVIKNAVKKGYERLIDMLITEFDEEKFINDLKEEGREEMKREISFNMIENGFDDETISKSLKCSLSDVQTFRKEFEERYSHR